MKKKILLALATLGFPVLLLAQNPPVTQGTTKVKGDLSVTGTIKEQGSRVCTVANGFCAGGGFTPAGDLSGSSSSQIVDGLLGHSLGTIGVGYPHWNGSTFVWDTPSGGGSGVASINSQTGPAVTVTGDSSLTVTTTTNNIALHATGGGGSGVQYNPTSAAYLFAGSSLLIDDGSGVSTVLPAVSNYNCTAGVCTVNLGSAYTGAGLVAGKHVDVHSMTSWPAPPTHVYPQDYGVGVFEITSATTTSFQFAYSTATPSCSSSCGMAQLTTYWASYWAGESQPYMLNHGKTYNAFGPIADLDTYFTQRINCSLGTPTYLIIEGGQNDLFNGDSTATIKGHFQSLWTKAHAAGCIVMQGTIVPFSGGYAASVPAIWNGMQDLNFWLEAQSITAATSSTGAYWDQIIDYEARLSDPIVDPPMQTSISTNKAFGEITNAALSAGNSGLRYGPPPIFSPFSYGLGSWGNQIVAGIYAYRSSNGTDQWMVFDSGNNIVNRYQYNGTLGGAHAPLSADHWPGVSFGAEGCNIMDIGSSPGNNDTFSTCVHYTSPASTSNYYLVTSGTANIARFYADGRFQLPGLVGLGSTQCAQLDATGFLTGTGSACGSGGGSGITNIQITTGTTAIAANTCTANTATTMTGVATTSAFSITPTVSTNSITGWGATGGLAFSDYPTANTFNWSVCNQTSASITPGASVTWNVGAK